MRSAGIRLLAATEGPSGLGHALARVSPRADASLHLVLVCRSGEKTFQSLTEEELKQELKGLVKSTGDVSNKKVSFQ